MTFLNLQYYRIMALEFHVEEKVGLGHYTLCEFIDIGARKWILTERLRTIPSDLGRVPRHHFPFNSNGLFIVKLPFKCLPAALKTQV